MRRQESRRRIVHEILVAITLKIIISYFVKRPYTLVTKTRLRAVYRSITPQLQQLPSEAGLHLPTKRVAAVSQNLWWGTHDKTGYLTECYEFD